MDPMKKRGMGWIPDYPDFRDYTEKTEEIHSVLGPKGMLKAKGRPFPRISGSGAHPSRIKGAWVHAPPRQGQGSSNITRESPSEGTSMLRDFSFIRPLAI